jgi:hypothetical protein
MFSLKHNFDPHLHETEIKPGHFLKKIRQPIGK